MPGVLSTTSRSRAGTESVEMSGEKRVPLPVARPWVLPGTGPSSTTSYPWTSPRATMPATSCASWVPESNSVPLASSRTCAS